MDGILDRLIDRLRLRDLDSLVEYFDRRLRGSVILSLFLIIEERRLGEVFVN